MVGSKSLTRSLLLKLLLLALMAAGVLVFTSVALAQGASTPGGQCTNAVVGANYCIDKTASPTRATVGQPLTFTITLGPIGNCLICSFGDQITDTLPTGVTFVSATATNTAPGTFPFPQPTCANSGNTVTCTEMDSAFVYPQRFPSIATIVVTPTRCGTFTNTANSANGISASADFTVNGCAGPNRPNKQQAQKQQPATPLTQDPSQTYVSGANTNNAGSVNSGGT